MILSYYAARANLYHLWQTHPQWTHADFAAALGCSKEWVKKWLKRLREELAAGVALEVICQGHSRVRKHRPVSLHPLLVDLILAMRVRPPEGLRRVPGPEAIHYYLQRDPMVSFFAMTVPSCKTIYRVLKAHGCIAEPGQPVHRPVERPAPLTCWQLDFKDVSSVPAEVGGKRQHGVETLNIIDMGTSLLLDAHVRADFTAETALEAVAQTMAKYGIPKELTLDRDPRWVGSPHGSDFPAALLRFGACLGVTIQVCAPHHPQENGFVERYNRTYQEECLAIDQPKDLAQAKEVTATFVQHYNVARPNQALSCANRPPLTAFPHLPSLPPLPTTVDPDSWLLSLDGLHLVRKVDSHGMVSLNLQRYYVSTQLRGHQVVLQLEAHAHQVKVLYEQQGVKVLPLRGLVGHTLSFEQFLLHMQHQARAQARLRSLQERRRRNGPFSFP